MAQLLLIPTLLLILCSSFINGLPGGAPFLACSNLVPKHRTSPMKTEAPYKYTFSKETYKPNDEIQVTITGQNGANFKGFVISARRTTGDIEDLVGSWINLDSNTARGAYWYGEDATGNTPNCATHSSNNDKSSVTLTWRAPSRSIGDVHFSGTIVQLFNKFWLNITSTVIKAEIASQEPPFTNIVHNTPPPDNLKLGSECGENVGCILTPAACSLDNCRVYAKFKSTENDVTVELSAVGENIQFVSIAFSDDNLMNDDMVITCTASSSNSYSIQSGYNSKTYLYWNERHRMTELKDKYIQFENNKIWCQFTQPLIRDFDILTSQTIPIKKTARRFNLFSNSYYIFLANGKLFPGTQTVSKHIERPARTASVVNVRQNSINQAYNIDTYEKAHGTLMLLAWLACGSIGIIMAEYYKQLLGTWFHIHRACVISAYVLSISGILVIFAKLNWKWSSTYVLSSVHGGFGISVVVVATGQIIMGLLRPHKDAPKRKYFNFAHRATGYTILALVDVTAILVSNMPFLANQYTLIHRVIIILWYALHGTTNITFGVLSYYNEKSKNTAHVAPTNELEMKEVTPQEGRYDKLLRRLFIVFVIAQLILCFTLIGFLIAY